MCERREECEEERQRPLYVPLCEQGREGCYSLTSDKQRLVRCSVNDSLYVRVRVRTVRTHSVGETHDSVGAEGRALA